MDNYEEQKFELRQERDFGQLINDTFVFAKQNWKPLGKAFLVIGGFFLLAGMLSNVLHQQRMIEVANGTRPISSPFEVFGVDTVFSIVSSLLTYLSLSLVTFCYISLFLEKKGEAPTVEEVWAYFKYFFLRFLGSQVLLSILLIIAFVFLIFPGLYLIPAFSIILAVIVFENAGFSYALDRGFKLMKSNWWITFGSLVIVGFITYALMMLFVIPMGILSGAGAFLSNTQMTLPALIVTTVFSYALQVLMLLPQITIALCYFNLVEKKEGTSLMDKVELIGTDSANENLPEEQY